MQMKVKNLFKEKKKCANESSESRTKRLATQSQYQRQKIANELAECREERLFNQGQYQKENIGVWVDYGGVKTCFSPLRFV